jgi:small-conductance mechanosensitive channel
MNGSSIQPTRLSAVWLIVVATNFISCPAAAQEEKKPDAGLAVTTANPSIPVNELELGLRPLGKYELANEAEGWLALLKAKAFKISAAEIAVQRTNTEIDEVEALAELVDESRKAIEQPKSDGSSPVESHTLIQERIKKIAELEARGTTDDAVASAVKSATERARQASVPQDAGNNVPDPTEENLSVGWIEKVATEAKDLVDVKNLEELQKKISGMVQAKESVRTMLFEDLDALRAERSAIIERLQTVLDAWKAKGGEIQEYELYIEAVDDVDVDTSDTATAWTTIVDWVGSRLEDVTNRLSGAAFDIVIVILLALAVWIAIKVAVKRNMGSDWESAKAGPGEGDGGGAGATRVETLLPLLRKFVSITLIVIVIMMSLSSLGMDVAPLLAGAGMVGIAIGFGAQTLVRDVVSGVFFLIDDAFRMGEYVEIENIRGTVEKISVRSLQLRHHNGPVHTLPFGEIRHLTNYSRDYAIMKFEIRLPFETDIDKVRKIIKKTGQKMLEDEELGPMMLAPLKSQGVNRMDDSALIIRCKFTAKPGEQFYVRREAYMRIQQALAEAGIRFAPRRVIVEAAPSTAAVSPEVIQAAAGSMDTPAQSAEGGATRDKPN